MDIKNIPKLSETQAAPEFEEQINRSSSNVASDSSGIAGIKDSTEVYSGDSFSAVIRNSSADSPPMDLEPLLNDVRNFLTDQGPMNVQDPAGNIFAIMMEYQKMLNKEARQDHKMQRADGQIDLLSKDAKLNLDNEKIADQQQEAGERFSQSMTEASTEMFIGLAGSLLKGDTQQDIHQMSSTLDALKQHASQIKDELLQNADEESGKRIVSRYEYLTSMFGDDDK